MTIRWIFPNLGLHQLVPRHVLGDARVFHDSSDDFFYPSGQELAADVVDASALKKDFDIPVLDLGHSSGKNTTNWNNSTDTCFTDNYECQSLAT